MNSDRYTPDDLTSDHDEDFAAEQKPQPKSAPAKSTRAKKAGAKKTTGIGKVKGQARRSARRTATNRVGKTALCASPSARPIRFDAFTMTW
jgi:hypothetical protein